MSVQFHFQKNIGLSNRKALKQIIELICKKEGYGLDTVNFIFCSDDEILEINKNYLDHNYFTDIITFHYHLKGQPIQSDIYISVDTVRSNAEQFSTTINLELHRVIFHGVLHLCGYKDKSPKDQKLMRKKEDEYLNLYFA